MPKVSVILTSFNHDKYIREAIDSVLKQTFVDFELIIWDDTSVDDSWEIIQSYSDARIRAFRNSQNKGSVFGINKAIFEAARGEYIAIHHSDNVWELDKLATQINFLDANQGIGAVFSNAQAIDQRGIPLTDQTHFYYNLFSQPNRSRHEWLRHFFFNGNALCHPSILIRKQCYIDCGAYRDMLAQLSDFDMWIRLCAKHEIHVMTERLIKFRLFDSEMNTRERPPMTRIRHINEHHTLLQQYRTIIDQDNIFKIFPDFISYHREADTDPEYVLSRVCLEAGDFFLRQLLAIEILFDILNNPARRQAIEKVYGFSLGDFIALTGRCDVFSRQELFNLTVESGEQITNLTHIASEQGKYIRLIENSLSWKMTRPLRSVFGSDSPLGIIGRRAVKFIWWIITLPLPKKLHESPLSKNGEETDNNQFSSSSDDDCPAVPLDYPIENPIDNSQLATPSDADDLAIPVDYPIEKPIITPIVGDTEKPQLSPPSNDYCHFAPPPNDCCLAVPFDYAIEKPIITPSVAVICHLYYPEILEEFKHYLSNIPFSFDLFITTDSEDKKNYVVNGLLDWNKGAVDVRLVPNRGRDIAPKLISCRDVYDRYEFFLHIHSKKSLHMEVLAGWRSYLLETLLGSEKIVTSIFEAFTNDPMLGMIAPEHCDLIRHLFGWAGNFDTAKEFSSQFGVKLSLHGKIDFPSGSMFWGRSAAIKPLLELCLTMDDFPPESNQTDATFAHVIERLYFFVCEQAGYRWVKIASPALLKNVERVIVVNSKESLIASIKRIQYGLLNSNKEKKI
jgi:glycosyltransferase involved in cell wall biosynthesis